MEIIYCNESDIPRILGEIGREASQKRLKVHVIPQFVGAIHTVFCFGTYELDPTPRTIILRPHPPPATESYIPAQGQDVPVSSQECVDGTAPG